MLSELPDDLNRQYIAMGPPPNWYSAKPTNLPVCEPSTVLIDIFPFLSSVDKSQLDNLKYERNEYNPQIPPVVRRYTNVEPLSPFFRSDRAKYGYGDYLGGGASTEDAGRWNSALEIAKSAFKIGTGLALGWIVVKLAR